MADVFCPSCGSPNVEQIDVDKYACPYCGTTFTSSGIIDPPIYENEAEQSENNIDESANQTAIYDEDTAHSRKGSKKLILLIVCIIAIVAVFTACFVVFSSSDNHAYGDDDDVLMEETDDEIEDISFEETEYDQEEAVDVVEPEYNTIGFDARGTIGSANDASIATYGGEGGLSYELYPDKDSSARAVRYMRNVSYDSETGEFSFDAYDASTDEYASHFSGIVYITGTSVNYRGSFRNYKGVQMNFSLDGQLWTSEPEGDWSDAYFY